MVIRTLMVFLLFIVIIIANAYVNPIPKRKISQQFKPLYGVSYSFEQAGWYGLSPKEEYVKMLEEIHPDWVRIPFFWDQMVDVDGSLKIDTLKYGIEEALKRNIKIIIALGAKVPYYPEFHLPAEIKSQIKFGEIIYPSHPIVEKLLAIDRKVVSELSHYQNITYWQIENEPLLGNVNGWKISPELINREAEVIRGADFLNRPIILNHPAGWFFDNDWKKLLPILKSGDVFATNAYFITQGTDIFAFKLAGREFHIAWPKYFMWPVQSWPIVSPPFASIKNIVEANGNDLWVLEMQSEPYIRVIADAKAADFAFTPGNISQGNDFLMSYGIKSIGLWGVHFWQFRDAMGDDAWINQAKKIIGD